MKYTIKSDRVAGHISGDVVDGDDLGGNVPVLLAAGHIKPQSSKPATATKKAST